MKLYPIINLSFLEAKLSAQEFSRLYWFIVDAVDDWTCRDSNIDHIEAIEFSLASPYVFENLFDIKTKLWEGNLELALASLISIDQLLEIKKHSYFIDEPIEVFAPAFDEQIAEMIDQDEWMNDYIDYIPAVYSASDVDEIFEFYHKVPKLKVFPMNPNTGDDLQRALEAPYPELRNYKAVQGGKELIITSPRDYQKIRKEFLLNPISKKLVFQPEQRNVQELVEHIKWSNPRTKIVLSGIDDDLVSVKSVKRIEFIATRMFKPVIASMLNASINKEEAKKLIAAELDQYSTLSA